MSINKAFDISFGKGGCKNQKGSCIVCAAGGVRHESMCQCEQCNVCFCISSYFENYYTKLHY